MKDYKSKELRRQLAINIDNAILDSGKTFKEIAYATGVHRNTLRHWADGSFTPPAIGLHLLSQALGVDVAVFYKNM